MQLFSKEILLLKREIQSKNNDINSLSSLNPFLDEIGILRVEGLLTNAPIEYDHRHPMILKEHSVVQNIVRYYNEKFLHSGVQLTLTLTRQMFWLIKGRQLVKSIIFHCVTCTRLKAATSKQLMAALPTSRINRPFEHVGLDYAGPLKIRLGNGCGRSSHAAYIAVFVCLAIRAVYLEVVSDYTAESFLAAQKRFVPRRGLPNTIHSDNGTNFKGANHELTESFAEVTSCPQVRAYLANDKVRWNFISPAAAYFGGIWESGVKSVKHHLKCILKDRTPTFEELNTLLCQIEMCLNPRPLSPLSDDPNDLKVLTSAHFLIGGELHAVPANSLLNFKESQLSRWLLLQQLFESFWASWSADYLTSLQQRNKWRFKQDNLCKNQIVLIKNGNLPPTKWAIGRITDTHKNKDGLVRVASVHTASGLYMRPITKLVVLPVEVIEN